MHTITVTSTAHMRAVLDMMKTESAHFSLTPLPDDEWEFEFRDAAMLGRVAVLGPPAFSVTVTRVHQLPTEQLAGIVCQILRRLFFDAAGHYNPEESLAGHSAADFVGEISEQMTGLGLIAGCEDLDY